MKAFFSYSHQQSDIVRSVAEQLGRPFVKIDKFEFRAADDIVDAMEAAAADSSMFVFFASRDALRSVWVDFEIREARYHAALRRIRKVVPVILDERVKPAELPEWMRRYKFIQSKAPRPIARVLRTAVDDLVENQQSKFFVGRAAETTALQAALVPPDSATPISVVSLSGLPGIGRTTLLARVARDSISIDRLLRLNVEEGDSVQDLTAKLGDLVEPVTNPGDSIALAKEILELTEPDAVRRFVGYVRTVTDSQELLVLFDQGGLIDNTGAVSEPTRRLLNEVRNAQGLMVALVSNRRPLWRWTPEFEDQETVAVGAMAAPDVRQLIALQARGKGLTLSTAQIRDMADQARGYPPAVNVLVQMAEAYGPELATRPGTASAPYSPRPISMYLRRLQPDVTQRSILQILSGNSPLPVQLIEEVVGTPADEVRSALIKLIDTSLVSPDNSTGWYTISQPIVDFVEREYAGCTREQYRRVAVALGRFLDSGTEEGSYLELERVRFRALMSSGQSQGKAKAMSLFADWVRLAERFYHQRDYEESLRIAQAAMEARPAEVKPLTWAIRSQVRLGQYEDAMHGTEILAKNGQPRDASFLRGFLERHRGKHGEAARFYERALADGYGGLAIHRDLAECYLHLDRLEKALQHIELAREKQTDNKFIIDLQIKILCREGKEKEASDLLPLLDAVDDRSFALHRRSRVAYQFGHMPEAYDAADEAVKGNERPAFEVLANLALCAVRTGRLEEAEACLTRLRGLYRNQRKDVQTAIRVNLLIAHQEYEEALAACRSFESKDRPQHLSLENQAISGILEVAPLNQRVQDEYLSRQREIEELLTKRYGRVAWEVDPE